MKNIQFFFTFQMAIGRIAFAGKQHPKEKDNLSIISTKHIHNNINIEELRIQEISPFYFPAYHLVIKTDNRKIFFLKIVPYITKETSHMIEEQYYRQEVNRALNTLNGQEKRAIHTISMLKKFLTSKINGGGFIELYNCKGKKINQDPLELLHEKRTPPLCFPKHRLNNNLFDSLSYFKDKNKKNDEIKKA